MRRRRRRRRWRRQRRRREAQVVLDVLLLFTGKQAVSQVRLNLRDSVVSIESVICRAAAVPRRRPARIRARAAVCGVTVQPRASGGVIRRGSEAAVAARSACSRPSAVRMRRVGLRRRKLVAAHVARVAAVPSGLLSARRSRFSGPRLPTRRACEASGCCALHERARLHRRRAAAQASEHVLDRRV